MKSAWSELCIQIQYLEYDAKKQEGYISKENNQGHWILNTLLLNICKRFQQAYGFGVIIVYQSVALLINEIIM